MSSLQQSYKDARGYRAKKCTVVYDNDKKLLHVETLESINDVGSGFIQFAGAGISALIPAHLIQHVIIE